MNRPFNAVGGILARYGLVVVLAWFGVLKFMEYEAKGIEPLVSESPLMNWLYGVFSVLFTTPGVTEATAGGFPALSITGEFLIKDVALFGIAVWTLFDALPQPPAFSRPVHRAAHGSNASLAM